MKLKQTADIPSFLQAVQRCKAKVWFTTEDQDELDLKSTLSQFVFSAVCVGDMREWKGSIEVEDPLDAERLAEYLMV